MAAGHPLSLPPAAPGSCLGVLPSGGHSQLQFTRQRIAWTGVWPGRAVQPQETILGISQLLSTSYWPRPGRLGQEKTVDRVTHVMFSRSTLSFPPHLSSHNTQKIPLGWGGVGRAKGGSHLPITLYLIVTVFRDWKHKGFSLYKIIDLCENLHVHI